LPLFSPKRTWTTSPNAYLHLRWIIFFKSLYFFHWVELLLFWCFLNNLFFRLVSCFISLLIHGWLYLVDVSFVGI
jgi:ABC-type transport system involved in cytochrome c biogenesis permease subunit